MFAARATFHAILVAALYLLTQPAVTLACSCGRSPACESFWDAELVFIGVAKTVSRTGGRTETTEFAVQEWLRGTAVGRQVIVKSYNVGGSCDYDFEQGTRYLVHANRRPYGIWRAHLCGGTVAVKHAFTDLKYIRDALAHPGPGAVSGHAYIDIDPGEPVRLGPPIPGALVILESGQRSLSTRTDKSGSFRFEHVPPGNYTRTVRVPDNLRAVAPKGIVVGKGACVRDAIWTVRR